MTANALEGSSRGAEWRRWDPHIHAPGTLLADQFGGNWEGYLTRIETAQPVIEALGVTDYFSIRTYQEVAKRKAAGRLSGVKLIFPNVEMRLNVETAKKRAINLHLLFSPKDEDHEAQIERVLSALTFEYHGRPYRCTSADLIALGQEVAKNKIDSEKALREGANQFKVNLPDLRKLFRSDEWVRKNCLVAIAGSNVDGTAGLQDDDSFKASRTELETFADMIFSSTPSQREYWLGEKPGHDKVFIESTYGFLKPCLHGSDAHRVEDVGAPAGDRYCWLKGDATFETLRQAVIEPKERVAISPTPPTNALPSMCVSEVTTMGTQWLTNNTIDLNFGLVAIIGARGSGKTALADMIAAGARAFGRLGGQSSFLIRASTPVNYLKDAQVRLSWGDGTQSAAADLFPSPPSDEEMGAEVAYLSQHFVEKLCSSEGLATELRDEMERVVFEATEPTSRLETTSFRELSEMLLSPIRRRRADIEQSMSSFSEQVVQEEILKEQLPKSKKQREEQLKIIAGSRKQLQALVPKGKEERAKELQRLEQLCAQVQSNIEHLSRRRKVLQDLQVEVKIIAERTEPERFAMIRRRFADAQLPETDWQAFKMIFAGDPAVVLSERTAELDTAIKHRTDGDPKTPADVTKPAELTWALKPLITARDNLRKEVGADAQKQKRYAEVQQLITRQEAVLRKLDAEIEKAEGADTRRRTLIERRRVAYADVFGTMREEEKVLEQLYSPLSLSLAAAKGALSKLEFVVQRRVDLGAWVAAGERLIDLRKATKLRGHGALLEAAEKYLLAAWQTGTAEAVAGQMDEFRGEFQEDLRKARPTSIPVDQHRAWVQNVASWLYGTSHIHVEYGIRYDGVAIEQLSPGTRGIVLLLLYLGVDRNDERPLVIDQPEENLDPNSVFTELVPHFREARKRRQIIVVTHNANLVVNTDADQVIIADAVRTTPNALPQIMYKSGGLENRAIRTSVCETLEGGERAFLERERRYRLRWAEAVQSPQRVNLAEATSDDK